MAWTDVTRIKEYIPEADLIQLTDDYNTGEVATDVVTAIIGAAQRKVEGVIRGRYPVDIDDGDVPDQIKDIVTVIAATKFYTRKLITTLPDSLKQFMKSSMNTLKAIQEGKISPFEEENEPERVLSSQDSTTKTFNSTRWGTYPTC